MVLDFFGPFNFLYQPCAVADSMFFKLWDFSSFWSCYSKVENYYRKLLFFVTDGKSWWNIVFYSFISIMDTIWNVACCSLFQHLPFTSTGFSIIGAVDQWVAVLRSVIFSGWYFGVWLLHRWRYSSFKFFFAFSSIVKQPL